MNRTLHPALAICLVSTLSVLLCACGTPSAKDFGGRWRPVNKYDDKVVEIPLATPYTYYAAPMDGTLKTMLTRWTTDTGAKLSYQLRSDFTLPKSASSIHTTESRDATAQLSAIYAQQGVVVIVNGPEIVVEEASAIVPPASATPAVDGKDGAKGNDAPSTVKNGADPVPSPSNDTPAAPAPGAKTAAK